MVGDGGKNKSITGKWDFRKTCLCKVLSVGAPLQRECSCANSKSHLLRRAPRATDDRPEASFRARAGGKNTMWARRAGALGAAKAPHLSATAVQPPSVDSTLPARKLAVLRAHSRGLPAGCGDGCRSSFQGPGCARQAGKQALPVHPSRELAVTSQTSQPSAPPGDLPDLPASSTSRPPGLLTSRRPPARRNATHPGRLRDRTPHHLT